MDFDSKPAPKAAAAYVEEVRGIQVEEQGEKPEQQFLAIYTELLSLVAKSNSLKPLLDFLLVFK